MLSNVELLELLKTHDRLIEGAVDYKINRTDSLIQPASIDLTVGEIWVPPAREDRSDTVRTVKDNHVLTHGATVLVKTREKLNLPDDIGGLMFPKNGQFALKGLMITNFGHVDPGYSGHLKYTVINFGADDFRIEVGHRITSLTLYRLAKAAKPSWSDQQKTDPDNLEGHAKVLSRDFLDIERRIAGMIQAEVNTVVRSRDNIGTVFLPISSIAVGVILGIGALFMPFYFHLESKIDDIYKVRSSLERIVDQ